MKTLESKIYTQEGKDAGMFALPEQVFGLDWNADLVHQVMTSMMTSKRTPVAHSRMRGEVRGGGKKPWQQKGTGRARHGSTRSPLWPGGGVTHGPRNDKTFTRKVNQKMKAKALFTLLSKKMRDGEVLFVDAIAPKEAKTKHAKTILTALAGVKGYEALGTKKTNTAFVAVATKDAKTDRSFNNINNVMLNEVRNMNVLDLLKYKFVVIENPQTSIASIASRLGSASAVKVAAAPKAPKTEKTAPAVKKVAKTAKK